MKKKFLKYMIVVFATMLTLTLTADTSLPRPIMGSHKFGVKFTVSGFEGETAVANLPVLVKISPATILCLGNITISGTRYRICHVLWL